ncbi:hypothetical protein GZH82_00585 [Staphylococcus ursi]|uniref:hypothetical protein n=1 Tax=Staphylococcus sp. MI 10-1553 TaxID=1912064 RepID=UPI00139861D2|nr:hypothetical protein [Staphylococcus sp. MI 10-1553]QHW35978.1 hypothetical protein GZH82_00585 [Staphylococcus sp. MI 10-1553]
MINYIKSELYRVFNSKALYLYILVCNVLMVLAAVTLFYFNQVDSHFPYGNAHFFYINVISASTLILIVGIAMNLLVNHKENKLMNKISVSFDVSRSTIFWGKFLVYLISFSLLCIISTIITVILGLTLFEYDNVSLNQYLISLINMAPLILGGLALAHTLNSFKINIAIVIILTSLIYLQSSHLFQLLAYLNHHFNHLYKLTPGERLNQNFENFMTHSSTLDLNNWIIGGILSLLFLFCGQVIFKKSEFNDE